MGFQRSPILWIPFYLYTHPLTQNCQIWRGNICGEVACFRGSAMPLPQGAGSQRSPILWVPFCLCVPNWCRITNHQFWASFLSVWSGVSHAHILRGGITALPNFKASLASFLFMRAPFVAEMPNLTWERMWGLYIGVSHAFHPTRAEFQPLSNFVGSPIFMPLTQNDQIWHGNLYGEGRVLEGQPSHCICTNASRGLSATAEFLV